MSSSEARPSPRPGDVLDGRYRLVARLGHGGFGDVWRAEELLPDGAPFRDVALKLLLAGGADAVDWAEEAKLLASFRHPSLVTIYAAGILAITPPQRFVAMELLDGQNLAELLRARGPIAWRRVLAWAMSAAAALDLIHPAGVVHLDLKPANLFLGGDGALKVLDFGIARRAGVGALIGRRGVGLSRDTTMREAEMATGLFIAARAAASHEDAFAATRPVGDTGSPRVVIGTPGFMAPEVLELAEPTAAADAYALAVCVVQLVTGHLPHAAPDEPASWEDPTAVSQWLDEIRTATLRGALRPIDAGAMGLPRGLTALIKRLLAVDPAQRGVTPGKLGALFEEVWERPHGVPEPPYYGLAPYPPEGEGLLFGRDDDTARLGRELEFEPAVVLQGPAGAGKTSLATAGIVPYLARRGADGKDDWAALPVAPGDDPDAALAAALARLSPDLAEADPAAITAWCDRSPTGIVLVVDPLEALAAAPEAKRARIDALIEAIAAGPARPGLRFVGAIREEGVPALLATPAGAALRAALRFVGAPATAAVKDIVAAPAHFAGVTVFGADRIAADVQHELRAGGVRLPYVALALADFWSARTLPAAGPRRSSAPPSSALSSDRWTATGGVGGAVVRHAERVLAGLGSDDRLIAEELLLRLSTTDGRPVRWDAAELTAALSPDHGRRVLDLLAREHLVHVAQGSVEIGHEALLTGWPTLASARLAQMDRLALLERLREARVAWERADGHRDFLLHGALLEEIHARTAWLQVGLTPADHAFLAASRRRDRRRLAARWVAGLLLLVLLAGGVGAHRAAEQAHEAEARARAEAAEQEELAELGARARRTEDPYQRVAFAAAAMERGSPDGLLPLEIAAAAGNVARGVFLTLDHVDGPSFPWDDRYLLGLTSARTLAVIDFRPPEPDVIEDVDLDFDPDQAEALHFKMPAVRRLRPHEAPIVEGVPFAFDTAFATRAADGEVKVFRLREDGAPVLAAIAPMRCAGAMLAAAAAPVVACATDRGVARWDLRRARDGGAVTVHPFPGNVGDVSADGERVAAFAGKEALFWAPGEGLTPIYTAPRPLTMVRLSPRDRVAALFDGSTLAVVDERRPAAPLVTTKVREGGVDRIRWDEGGLDVGVCAVGHGRWYYLKRGGRAKDDPPPRGEPCAAPRPKNQPEPIRGADDYRDLGERDVGPHALAGGFKLRRRRYLSRDLVLFDAAAALPADVEAGQPGSVPPAAARLLRFDAKDEIGNPEARPDGAAIAAVERDDVAVMFQIGEEMRFYAALDGARLFARKGNFVRRCEGGRYLAWTAEGARYLLTDGWTGGKMGEIPREPGLVLGADAACATLYTQRLDGTIVASPIAGGEPRALATADGYAYLARPSYARGAPAGLLVAFGSGAIARIEEGTGGVRVLAYASPRATAVADGPHPGEVVFADTTGVVLVRPGAAPTWLRDGAAGIEWEDLAAAPAPDAEGGSILLAADDRLAVVDVARRELLGTIPNDGRGHLTRWDDDGSVLAWSFTRSGGAEGIVVPRSVALARAVSAAISNLTVDKGRITLRR